MEAIIKRVINNQLQDFKGMQAAGKLVLSDELMNEVINVGLGAIQPTENTRPEKESSSLVNIDPIKVMSWLSIDQLQYRTEEGKTIVQFKASM
ncbi:MAG: hypothetical protein AAFU67_08610 [Bacteroidota bacterium]